MIKYSRQRAAILAYLRSRKDHPGADAVYEHVREEFPNISLGTVYRNLTLLAETGEIARLQFGELGIDRFDADTSRHEHFVCSSCQAVIDLDMGDISAIDEEAARDFDGKIMGHRIYFTGLCKNCLTGNTTK